MDARGLGPKSTPRPDVRGLGPQAPSIGDQDAARFRHFNFEVAFRGRVAGTEFVTLQLSKASVVFRKPVSTLAARRFLL